MPMMTSDQLPSRGQPQGLLARAMQEAGTPPNDGAGIPGDEIPDTTPGEGLSPEETAKLKQAKQAAMGMLFDDKVFGELIKRFDSGDRISMLANTVVLVLGKVEQAVGQMSLASLLALAMALIGEVAEVIADTGREAYTSQEVEHALYVTVQLWLGANKDRVDPQELQAGLASLQQHAGG